ncbi:hypothetical protein GCK32_004924 [Trichostrongylus colubriformis]|uniref:Uncharacterized protein n=1 Tax=Trichostrongylus colubriformis TaxID=6319 RepID=A0AAN8IEE6_TRICO
MWSSSCIPVIILLLCQESVELNPLCTPKRGSDAEFVVDFVFFIDHMLGQDAVDRIKYLYKAISCEVPASRRYHLATVDMTADTATVTPWKSSKTFPETLEGGKEAGQFSLFLLTWNTEIPSTTAPPATSVVSTTNEATSVVITTNEATSTVAKTTEASTPLETTEAITSRQQKSSSIEPKTSLTSESILTTPADTTVRPRREFKVLWRKTQTKAAPSRSNEEPSEDGAAQEPLIDEERSSGIQVFHAEKSAGQQPSGSSSGTHHKSQYKPYFIPLLILIIILALIIIFLLICIICLMKLEEKEDYKSEPSSRPSEKKPLLSKSEGTDTKTPKKSPSKKKPEPAPIMVPPPEEEPREEPQPPRDTDSANFAPIIISGKPRKERSHGEGGPGAPGACDQRGGDGQREASEGKGSRDATQDQQAPPAPIKETGSSKERENMPKISTDHMF